MSCSTFYLTLRSINFEFQFKNCNIFIRNRTALVFFLSPGPSFPSVIPSVLRDCVPFCSLTFAVTAQSTIIKISTDFSLPCLRFFFPSNVNQSVYLQTKNHFSFKNELSSRKNNLVYPPSSTFCGF